MPAPDEILEEIDARLPEALTLTVGRLVDDAIEAAHVALAAGAADGLREHVRSARLRIAGGSAVPYVATAELAGDEVFVIEDDETLGELGSFRDLAVGLGAMPHVAPADLDPSMTLYAVSVGDGSERVVFVRRSDPRLVHRGGRFLAIGRDQLTRIDGPVFAFSPDFDVVIASSWAVVLHQRRFELLFRDLGLVERHVSTWIRGITDHLPLSAASVAALRAVALRDSRTWRRLRDIERRGHLAHVTVDQVAAYAGDVGLDPAKVVVGGELVFDPAERFGFLHLLNEDLYKGPLTGDAFESQRKSAVE